MVTYLAPWQLLDTQSSETTLPPPMQRENKMQLAPMSNRRRPQQFSPGKSHYQTQKIFVTFWKRTSLNQLFPHFPLGRSQCSWSGVSSSTCLLLENWVLHVTGKVEDSALSKVSDNYYSVRTCSEQLKVFRRERSCYCHGCIVENSDSCENKEWVGNWKEVVLSREPSGVVIVMQASLNILFKLLTW